MPNLALLIAQIAVILVSARLVGLLFRRLGQPQVVGEMVAGILLGPSLLGWAAPAASAALFPPSSLGYLNSLSQVGLLLFMFLVGLELDTSTLRSLGRTAVVTSNASIVVPFALGAGLAASFYPTLSDPGVGFPGFVLFMGAAMSVTAFPVLARILTERGLLRTRVGTVAIACAAVDDVTAWWILAAIVAFVRSTAENALPFWATVAGTLAFVGVAVFVLRPALCRLETRLESAGGLSHDATALIVLLVLASAWLTELLGIHALFGAFLAGAVMPKGREFARHVGQRLEPLTVVLLLPLFFAFTGLRTSVGLLAGPGLWLACGAVVLVAVAGKLGGATIAARASGMPWREATAVGILMNTRGLMELVILNVGLDIGVINRTVYTMMVVMALVTTLMTSPLLEFVYPARLIRESAPGARDESPVAAPPAGA